MLTQKRLKELLKYDLESRRFRWKVSRGPVKAGDIAGGVDPDGYWRIMIDGILYKASRLAFLYVEGYLPEHDVDHINRIKDDDRWKNLRVVSRQCNARNTGNRSNNTSGVKGIYWHKPTNKWEARIMVDGKLKHLGYYEDFDDAVCARLAGEQCLDWSGCDSTSPAYQYVKDHIQSKLK